MPPSACSLESASLTVRQNVLHSKSTDMYFKYMISCWFPYSEAESVVKYVEKDTRKCTVHSIV